MHRREAIVIVAAASFVAIAAVSSPALAQTFQNYRCADGTQFIAGFYQHDSRAYLQVDGTAVTLARRLTLSGSRYSGSGVTLKITKSGITLRHAKRPTTACEPT
jgi:membrane-bound inhibitor of C-type lysozyme